MSHFTHEMVDRRIESTKEGLFCSEFICIKCPSCRNETHKVVTGTDRTFYGHLCPDNTITYCVVERYKDDIPDELLYVQRVQGNNEDLNISSVPSVW